MFDQLTDNLVHRFTPHAVTLRDECRMWAGSVIERLDRIADAVTADDVYDLRRPVQASSVAGPAAASIEVPATDEWILESVIARTAPAAAATLDIRDASGGALRFAADIPVTGALTSNFAPLRFMGGSELVVTMSQPGEFRLIFRYSRVRARRPSLGTGWSTQTPDRLDAGQETQNDARHVGTWHPTGVNVHGVNGAR